MNRFNFGWTGGEGRMIGLWINRLYLYYYFFVYCL